MFPAFIEEAIGREILPYWLQKNEIGGIIYTTLFTVIMII
jgi:hypothetical protein